ncbi:MAG: prepilin-type N-terminal cleavage/methylation domain-containing protein [Opitutales bacterium]
MTSSIHAGRPHERGSGSGFTLVEVMFAMVLFALIIAGGLTAIRQGFSIVEGARHYTRVSQIAQSEMEAIRSLSWKAFSDLPATEDIDVNARFDDSVYQIYNAERKIIDESSDRKRVEVTVTFTNRSGRDRTMKYVTYFVKDGVNDYYYRTI